MRARALSPLVLLGLFAALGAGAFAQPNAATNPATKPAAKKAVTAAAAPAPPAQDADAAPEAARKAEVVARFEGGQVTVGDLEAAIAAQSPLMQKRYAEPETLRSLVDKTVRFELLAAEAARRGYDKNDAVVFSVKQNAVQAMIKKEFDDKQSAESIPEADVKKYYDEHIAEFVRPAMRRASQIVLASEADAKALVPEAKSGDLRAFRELARIKSLDETTKLRGGDLRYFDAEGRVLDEPSQSVDPALAKAVFALKTVGDVAGPVQTAAGFAIVKLTGERPGHSESLGEAGERIRMRLWRERRQAAIDAMLAEVKKQHPTEIHPELLDAIKFEGQPVPATRALPPGFPQAKPPAAPATIAAPAPGQAPPATK